MYICRYIHIYIYVPRAIYNYEEVCLYIHQYVTTLWHKDRDLIWLEEEMFLSNKNIVGYLHARTHMYIYIYIYSICLRVCIILTGGITPVVVFLELGFSPV